MSAAIVWFRRDLRVRDQPALCAALAEADTVIPAFCIDDRLLRGRHGSGPRTQFLLESLGDLDRELRHRHSRLVVRRGDPARELLSLARATGARTVHACVDAGPFARARDRGVAQTLRGEGISLRGHPGVFVIDDLKEIVSQAGRPYSVFTPFYRAWLQSARRNVFEAPGHVGELPAGLDPGRIPSLAELGLSQTASDPAVGGERAGEEALSAFLAGPIADYRSGRNELGEERCSRLSPYLHFGCVSPRELEARLPGGRGAQAFRRQIAWRDFYAYVLRSFPDNARQEYQERFRGSISWGSDEETLRAWCEGRTGFPLVDAAMHQLRREGWMHNRARLVVGSFLTKDLGLDWRLGERHFMRLLIDGDEASNNGGWQWIASVGVDPQPVFKRIFNPALQQQRFDPDGSYVRRYLPALREVPDLHLGEPWRMPDELQRSIGCVIGEDYPAPIVDHLEARRAALARYGSAA
ncbi:MAG TPA: deoxyribodipyrimidine photo-lyase [Solirubrobacteraceae bacterium]|jgi:deoxyribodipyrimidine photo-lyase|nr:deoxyribodipyrimidine photo-lyase [Solirubrobacteraceae bacterium]